MAFEGDLSNLQLGDIFQTLAMTRQQGTFVVRGKEERRIAFSERGIALLSERASLGRWVGNYLVGGGHLPADELEAAQEVLRRRREGYLPDILVERGNCGERELRGAMRYVAAEEIYDLFAWTEGRFEFLAGEEDSTGPFAEMWFDVGSIAMEAARRLDEAAQFLGHIRPADIYVWCDATRTTVDPEEHGKHVALVYRLLDGSRTVEQLEADAALGRFDVSKSIGGLLEAQLIRIAGAAEIRTAAQGALKAHDFPRAAGLFQAACKIEPDSEELRQEVAEALVKCQEKRAAASHYVDLGTLQLRGGRPESAEDSFKKALRLDNACAPAHAGLMHAYVSTGEVAKGIDAARHAASRWIAAGEHDEAIAIAKAALDHEPGDVNLRMALANAQLGAGNDEAAVSSLDELVGILETSGAPDGKLLEAYRTIVKLAPERRDAQKRIDEIHARGRARRRKVAQMSIGGALVVVLAVLAIPMLVGPSIDEQVTEAVELLNDRNEGMATSLAQELLANPDLTNEQRDTLKRLLKRIRTKDAPKVDARDIKEAQDALAEANLKSARHVQDKQYVEGLQLLLDTLHSLEDITWREIARAEEEVFKDAKNDVMRESQIQLDLVLLELEQAAVRVLSIRDSFTEDVFRKTEPSVMRTLVDATLESQELERSQNWDRLPELATELIQASGMKQERIPERVAQTVHRLTSAFKTVNEQGARALAEVSKYDLQQGFHTTRRNGHTLVGEGRFEEATAQYQSFLDRCADLAAAEPVELYGPIEQHLLEEVDMDGRIESKLATLRRIIATEEQAQRALDAGDIAAAYDIRTGLVKNHREMDFETRFSLPVKIETRPEGAKVFLLDTDTGAKFIAETPCTYEIALTKRTRLALMLDGFKEHVIERTGAFGEGSGSEVVDLIKTENWRSEPGSTTEAAPAVSNGRVFIADRTGIVRVLSVKDGTEINKHDTQLVSGIASAVAVTGGRIYVSTLDGFAFVFDENTLAPIRTIELDGPGRAAPLPFDADAVLADEGGVVRRVSADGSTRWKASIGGKVKTDPIRHGSSVLFTTTEGNLVSLDGNTGRVNTRIKLGDHPKWSSPVIDARRAYLGSDEGEVVCVDLYRKSVVWRQPLGEPVPARPTISNGQLIVGTLSGSVFTLDLESGGRTSRALVGGEIRSDLLGTPEGFVVVTENGLLTHFGHDGQPRWVYDARERVSASPRMHEGKVLIVCRDGTAILLSR